jgi:hypothetical protein
MVRSSTRVSIIFFILKIFTERTVSADDLGFYSFKRIEIGRGWFLSFSDALPLKKFFYVFFAALP